MEYGLTSERSKLELCNSLSPLIKEWFFSKFEEFSLTQKYGVLPIFERKNVLICAPTGGTKTLTAFLSILNYLVSIAEKEELENRTYCLYCSPLKALSNDIFINLIKPLEEINKLAEKKGIKLQKIRVGLRTGDTSASEKAKLSKNAPHILVTTPESLAIMINSPKFSENFKMLEFLIVDEIHSLAENKRGVHFSLTMERLQNLSIIPFVRIGLSATVAPLDKIANYLVGCNRECLIADVPLIKKIDLEVLSPVKDFLETTSDKLNSNFYKMIDRMIQENKTTLIFTNTRAATERIVHNLKEIFPKNYIENIGAHHASLSKEHRFEIEEKLRKGELKVVVCSTSLELGIDIGFIDLVLMLESPKAVSRAMQRVGRAGHQLHANPKGKFIVTDIDGLVECSLILKNVKEKKIDKIHIPRNCLDVLAQHIYGMAIEKTWKINEMFELIKKSYCYETLTREDFFSVIYYLAGDYDLDVKNLYSKIWHDAETGEIGKRGKMARVIYMTNIGTIPDESHMQVVLRDGSLVGFIDEMFLEKMKKGDVFVLGGKRYQFMYTKGMKIYVIASVRSPTIPSWFSEMLPLSFDVAISIGKFRKLVNEMFEFGYSPEEIKGFIRENIYSNEDVSEAIYNYFQKQFDYSIIPHERRILIEEYRFDKNYIIFHTLFGRRVNDTLSRALAWEVGQTTKRDIEIGINDNGFYLAGESLNLDKVKKVFSQMKYSELRKILELAIEKTEILKRRFRHCAARGLMILRNYRGQTKSVGRQQMSSHFLLSAINKKAKEFPILKEAKREVLEDLMDIENAEKVLRAINNSEIEVVSKNIQSAVMSPFAINLILQSHTDFLKLEDKIDFIKRVYAELERNKP